MREGVCISYPPQSPHGIHGKQLNARKGGQGRRNGISFLIPGSGKEIDEGYGDYADLHGRFGMNSAAG